MVHIRSNHFLIRGGTPLSAPGLLACFRPRRMRRRRAAGILLSAIAMLTCVGFSCRLASAGTILSGSFSSDDDEQRFRVTVNGSPATIETTSYAHDGFDPVLSLFDASGELVALNDNGTCAEVDADPVTGACLDSYLALNLKTGKYSLILTEYDNLPNGPTLADGFSETGNGDFTGDLFGQPGQSFIDFTGSQRTDKWSVEFNGVSSASQVPEPASLAFAQLGIGLFVIAFKSKLFRRD